MPRKTAKTEPKPKLLMFPKTLFVSMTERGVEYTFDNLTEMADETLSGQEIGVYELKTVGKIKTSPTLEPL